MIDTRLRVVLAGLAGLAGLLTSACGDDIPDVAAQGSTALPPGQVDSTTGGNVGDDDDDDDPTTAGSSETGFDPPVPECGNGFVEGDEQCDDGNRTDDDACNNICQVPCGLDVASLVLPPTNESVIDASFVAAMPDDGSVVAGLLREITTDQRGNEQIEDDVAQVIRFDAAGRVLWTVTVDNPLGDLDAAGLAVDDAGDIVLAATADDPDGTQGIVVVKLAADDGAEAWRHTFDGTLAGEDDPATGVALTPEQDVIVAGQTRVDDGDDDVWVRKLAAADGTEIWTTTYSGAGNGSFSTDDGGPVAVDDDGNIWVLALEYVDFDAQPPVLLRFGPDGGPAELELSQMLPGTAQDYFLADFEGADQGVFGIYGRDLGTNLEIRLVRWDGDGSEVWAIDNAAIATEETGSDWRIEGVAPQGDEVLVAGTVDNDVTIEDTVWQEVWVARLMADGTERCRSQYRGDQMGLLPPSIVAADAAVAGDGQGLVSGLLTAEGDTALWLGRFRAQ